MSTDPFLHDDAAYVLGALSWEERSAFEAHLSTCVECTRRVSEIRPLMGLLAEVDADALETIDEPVPETLLAGLLRAARREQRRRRGIVAALGSFAAACLVALVLVVALPGPGSAGHAQAMTAVVASPVHASATLTDAGWGTKIELACRYDEGYSSRIAYSLVVIDRQGHSHDAGSWTLTPGQVTRFTSGTSLARDQISKVEITLGSTPILQLSA